MPGITLPHVIANGTAADGNEVDANFDALAAWVNGSALEKSGGTMTGALVLSGAPTVGNGAATKTYVDGKAAAATPADLSVTKAKMAAGLIPPEVVADITARDALTPTVGALVWVASVSILYRGTGSGWKAVTPQVGTGTLTWTASKASAIVTTTFATAFGTAPIVVASCSPITGNTETIVSVRATSTTNFTAQGYVGSGASVTSSVAFWWMAFEP